MNADSLIVSQALIQNRDEISLHPDLLCYEKQLSGYKQQWFHCCERNPLGWYAALCDYSPAALLASQCEAIPAHTCQCWVASPYHAQLGRDSVRIFPEGLFPWAAEDSLHLCEILNPMLADDGMQLLPVGAALLLACREPVKASPEGFGAISGKNMPDRHHEGEDGGRLNRLLSEIQMLLFQHPSVTRRERGEVDVNGIWLWAPTTWPLEASSKQIAVATQNPLLHAIVEGKGAGLIITEVERLGKLVQTGVPLPKRILLAGEGYALLLQKTLLPKFTKTGWQPKSVRPESILCPILHGYIQ